MVSVTARMRQIRQPRGGYLPPRKLEKIQLSSPEELHPKENIFAGLVGLAVDYLNRLESGDPVAEAFRISLRGANLLGGTEIKRAGELLKAVKGLDDDSIRNACQLVGYDTVLRAGPHTYQPVQFIEADGTTIANIRMMVERSQAFLETYGPVRINGISFGWESLGKYITSGDGDFATIDTLWDIKVSKNPPKKEHTLQLLIYYLMGQRSEHLADAFDELEYLGIYNPRLNVVYRMPLADVSDDISETVKRDVIGYDG